MKQKLPWIIVAILGVLLVGSRSQLSSQAPANPNGRFQIVGVEHNVGGTPGNDQGVAFRIDTQTGETATYVGGHDLSDDLQTLLRFSYWEKVDEKVIYHDEKQEVRAAIDAQKKH
jgi:hypothetical protein